MSKKEITKVCIVAPVHIWDDVRVFHKEAVSLAQKRYDVTLLAKIEKKKKIKGVNIIPVKTSERSRMLRFSMLPVVFCQALYQNADIYHLHNPDTLPIGFFLKLFGKKVIYDTHEDFTKDLLTSEWVPKIFRKPLGKLVGSMEAVLSNFFDAAIVTQKHQVSRLGSKAVLIQNPPRTNSELFDEVEHLKKEIQDPFKGFRLIYIGSIAKNRGLYTMVDALELINKKLNTRLWLIGSPIENHLKVARKQKGWRYVDYIPRLPQEEAFAHVALSDIGLIVLNDVGGHEDIDPNKIYEYMTFGIPFIASNFDRWIHKIGKAKAGWFVPPDSPLLLSEKAIQILPDDKIREQYRTNGLQFIKNYNWEKESIKLLKLYHKVNGR